MRIDVPWGHIAGKWYGLENVRPILMVHGWQDNAGSFDPLVPLLPQNFSYLSIDWPGHGLSSHLPKGCYYHSIDFLPILEIVRQHYKWEQLSFVSHSMGSTITFIYAWLRPDKVNLVCALDTVKPFSVPSSFECGYFEDMVKKLLKHCKEPSSKDIPDYTYDEMLQHIHKSSKDSIDLKSAKYLIERGTQPSPNNPNRLCLSRDVRINYIDLHFANHKVDLQNIKRIKSPYLFIRGDDQHFSETEKQISETVEMFQQHNKQFEFFKIDGTHHFHMNQPELINEKVGAFLKKYHKEN